MKVFKYLLFAVLGLVVVLAGLVIAVPMMINPNDYKSQIQQLVAEKLQRQLDIRGDIRVAFSLPLSLSFELGQTALSNPSGFESAEKTRQSFASIKKIALNAQILPLLQENRLQVGKIILHQADVNLLKNKKGEVNWNFAGADTSADDSASQEEGEAGRKLPQIVLEGVELQESRLRYVDESSGQKLVIRDLNLNISEVSENRPITISFKTRVELPEQKLTLDIQSQTQALLNLKQSRYKLQDLQLSVASEGKLIPGGRNLTRLSADIVVDLMQQSLKVGQLKVSSYEDLQLQGDITVNSLLTDPQYQSHWDIRPFSPRKLLDKMAIPLPELKHDDVLNSLSMQVKVSGNSQSLTMNDLQLQLDDIKLSGSAGVQNFSRPGYDFKLDINQLNLDRYALASAEDETPAPSTGQQKSQTKQQDKTKQQVLIPVDLIRQLKLNGQLKLGELIMAGVRMRHILIKVKSRDGVLSVSPVQSDFYKGKLSLSSEIDVRKKQPQITFQQDFKRIDLGQLLKDSTGTQEFTGTANIISQIRTHGNTQSELKKNLNGSGHFHINDGHIAKLDVLHGIRKAYAIAKGLPVPTEQQQANTSFTELKGSFNIVNGVISNQDLYSKSPLMILKGKGTVDLPREYLDYTLFVKLLGSLKIDKNTDGADFRNYEIPYTIKGKFDHLSKQANVSDFLKQQLKIEAKRQLNKQLNKFLGAEKGTEDKAAGGKGNELKQLKGLLGF